MKRKSVKGEVSRSQIISPAVDVAPTATSPASITSLSIFTRILSLKVRLKADTTWGGASRVVAVT
jgi:hypothetical protein